MKNLIQLIQKINQIRKNKIKKIGGAIGSDKNNNTNVNNEDAENKLMKKKEPISIFINIIIYAKFLIMNIINNYLI